MKLFFCHSSTDKPIVREIIATMTPSVRAWIDEDELIVGQNIKQSLKAAIDSSAFVVAVLSRSSIESDWVKFELKTAIKREKNEKNCVILPVVIDPITDQLPSFIRERRYLTLHDRSKRQLNQLSTELREGVATWAMAHDPIPRLIESEASYLRAASVKDGKTAGLIAVFLPDLMLKKIRAIYFKEIGGFESVDAPPEWLVACINTAAYELRTSHQAGALIGEHHKQLLDQCFLVGYYATFLRRPIDGIEIDDSHEFDPGQICMTVEELKVELQSGDKSAVPENDIAAWNVGVTWIATFREALIANGSLGKSFGDEDVGKTLIGAMWYGTMVCRAVERLASKAA